MTNLIEKSLFSSLGFILTNFLWPCWEQSSSHLYVQVRNLSPRKGTKTNQDQLDSTAIDICLEILTEKKARKSFTWTYTSGAPSMTVLDSVEYWLYIAKAFSVINKRNFNICLDPTRRGKVLFQLEI